MAESIGELIYRAVCEIHQQGGVATREAVARVVNVKMALVDDHLKRLINDERLRRVTRGVVAPVQMFPADRAVSVTTMPNGLVKLEIGEHLVELTPREVRHIGSSMVGFTLQFGR